MYEPVNLAFAKMADKLGMDVTDVIMKNMHRRPTRRFPPA